MDIDDVDDGIPSTPTATPTTTTPKTTATAKKATKTTTKTSTKAPAQKSTSKKSTTSQKKNSAPQEPDPFEGKDYYQCFDVERDATDEQIVKAYKKLAMKYHPDRHPNDPVATRHFASVSKMHQTLIDPRKRQFYDAHGENTDMSEGFLNAYDLWKQTCPDLTPDDTNAFRLSYEDTEEEYTDVVNAFNKRNGDLYLMMKDELFFSSADTIDRDTKMVEMLIARGDITNQTSIATFKKTQPFAATKLAAFQMQQEMLHAELEAKAHERAAQKSKNGVVTEFALMYEMRNLAHQMNRGQEGANTLENIALSLGAISGERERAEAEAKQTMVQLTPATTGGRMAGKKQSRKEKLKAADLSESYSNDEEEEEKEDEKLDKAPNKNKRQLPGKEDE